MRAIYLPNEIFDLSQEVHVAGDNAHHLLNVARIRSNDSVLILNGSGTLYESIVINIDKKKLDLKVISIKKIENRNLIDLAICRPKKEAFELILKIAVELGLNKLIPTNSAYSQKFPVNDNRLSKLIESAVVQSNYPFKFELDQERDLIKLNFEEYEQVFLFTNQTDSKFKTPLAGKNILYIIGPEGGFSEEEIQLLKEQSKVHIVSLETNILRAPTAVAVGAGWILGQLKSN